MTIRMLKTKQDLLRSLDEATGHLQGVATAPIFLTRRGLESVKKAAMPLAEACGSSEFLRQKLPSEDVLKPLWDLVATRLSLLVTDNAELWRLGLVDFIPAESQELWGLRDLVKVMMEVEKRHSKGDVSPPGS